jgi:hypothetical protein
MGKISRFKYGPANERGTKITKTTAYTITEQDILKNGSTFFVCSGVTTLTLPAASYALKGVSVYVTGDNANSKVTVVAGFGGGGSNFDVVTVGAYNTVEFWCNGSYWYALSNAVAGS